MIPFEVHTLEDTKKGKKAFNGYIDEMADKAILPGRVYAICLVQQEEPAKHQVAMMIEGEIPGDNGVMQKFDFFTVIPAFAFLKTGLEVNKVLQANFKRLEPMQADA